MRVFPPSTIAHPWRETVAVFAVAVWVSLALAWFFAVPLLWLLRQAGPIDWHIGEMGA